MSADPHSGTPAPSATTATADVPTDPADPTELPDPASAPGPRAKALHRKKGSSPTRNVVEWVVIIAAALLVALVIKQFLVQAFYIPSASMEKSLNIGDRVLVNKLSYHLHPVHRGDIVVFKRPPSEVSEPGIKDLIKRVVAIPGDTIESRDGALYRNGQLVDEPYLQPGTVTIDLPRQTIAPGHYFVMGDNRTNSKDARVFGAIPRSLIVGRAFVRVRPLQHFSFL